MIQLILILILMLPVFAREKWQVESVEIRGLEVVQENSLKRLMLTRPHRWYRRHYFDEFVLLSDRDVMVQYLTDKGYLDAAIEPVKMEYDSLHHKVSVTITIHEGERYHFKEISFLGNMQQSDSTLQRICGLKAGEPVLREKIEKANDGLFRYYGELGFLDVRINTDLFRDKEDHTGLLVIHIEEGGRTYLGEFRIHGEKKTKAHVISRELTINSGDLLKRSQLVDCQRQLYLTGIFQSVHLHLLDISSNGMNRDVAVELVENPSIKFQISVGYGSLEYFRARLELSNINFRRRGQKLGLAARYNALNKSVAVSFTEPWTYGTRWKTDVNTELALINEPGYELKRYGGEITVGRNIKQFLNIAFSYKEHHDELVQVLTQELPEDLRPLIRSFKTRLMVDRRDNLFDARRGYFVSLSQEFGAAFSSEVKQFARTILSAKYFKTLTRGWVFASGIEVGLIKTRDDFSSVPLQERLYAGGPTSVRGFAYQKLGPLDSQRIPSGGALHLILNLFELRIPIYKILGAAVFTDMGQVWSTVQDAGFSDIRYSPGCGLRFKTALGTIRAEIAFNPDSKSGEDPYQIILLIGQAF